MAHLKIDRSLINQAEIARRLNISESYVGKILSQKRTGTQDKEKLKQIEEIIKTSHKAA